jgi:hypothetical protein
LTGSSYQRDCRHVISTVSRVERRYSDKGSKEVRVRLLFVDDAYPDLRPFVRRHDLIVFVDQPVVPRRYLASTLDTVEFVPFIKLAANVFVLDRQEAGRLRLVIIKLVLIFSLEVDQALGHSSDLRSVNFCFIFNETDRAVTKLLGC